jgi:hypothetical protein
MISTDQIGVILFLFWKRTAKSNFQVDRVILGVEASLREVWTETRSSICGGLRILPDGYFARKFLRRGRQRKDSVSKGIEVVVLEWGD